uniref:Suppressor of IKBKE 1 n=1 Tax=Falco tinnunculus TaxID=100819 RepID=A0A8C4UCX3_FALTI
RDAPAAHSRAGPGAPGHCGRERGPAAGGGGGRGRGRSRAARGAQPRTRRLSRGPRLRDRKRRGRAGGGGEHGAAAGVRRCAVRLGARHELHHREDPDGREDAAGAAEGARHRGRLAHRPVRRAAPACGRHEGGGRGVGREELWVSLEEHQDALELIMSKYRKQMLQLLQGRKGEGAEPVLKVHRSNSLEIESQIDRIREMGEVMRKAIQVDDDQFFKVQEKLAQLELENKELRELLSISKESFEVGREDLPDCEA